MNRTVLVLSVTMLASNAIAAERIPPDVLEHVTQRVDYGYCVGLVVGVVDAEGTSYVSRGRFSKTSERPVDENTVFEIGSITKAFTAVALADMVERKVVALDDPVQNLLPPSAQMPKHGDRQITLGDLATHRSGLPRLPDNLDPKNPKNPYADYTQERMFQFLAKLELKRDIGAEYEYSNFGVGLLGHALAHRAGTSYEQLVIDRICTPLGMSDTRITLSDDQRSRLATGHAEGAAVSNWDLDALAGAGALRSTPRDMLRFMSANLGLTETPLAAALKESHRERFETGESGLFMALGWHIWKRHGATIIWHNGGTGGYHSFCGFNPERKLGVVVLTNSTEDIDDIGLHLLEPKFELSKVTKVTAVDPALLDEYLGYYELAPGRMIHVTRDGGQLFAQLTGQDKLAVYAESPAKFAFRVVDAQLSFQRGDDGKVDRLTLHQMGDHSAPRRPDYRPPEHVEITVDPAILTKYVGKYQLPSGAMFDVILTDGQLRVQLANQPRFPVFAESPTKFFYKVVEAQLTFVVSDSGEATELILHQSGMNQKAKRVP